MKHRVLSCAAVAGEGGLGQHLDQLVCETSEAGIRASLFCSGVPRSRPVAADNVNVVAPDWRATILRVLNRLDPARANGFSGDVFDQAVARRLCPGPDYMMGFVGKSLYSFRRAQEFGFERLELVAANSHVRQVVERHRQAYIDLGLKDTWLGPSQVKKTLAEYDEADRIYVHSDYTRDSMLAHGIAAEKLVRTHLTVDPRFAPGDRLIEDDVFRVIYVGRLDATKGVPLLIRAFKALGIQKSLLRLVGGFPSRATREYLMSEIGDDERIAVSPGDPVDAMRMADVLVHPTYEDGFAYAPAEALACGTPVVVTEDTGMKEYVVPGRNGFVVPTGELEALVAAMKSVHAAPLKSPVSLLETHESPVS